MARQVHDAVIANGASQSGIIDCGSEYTLTAIEIPTAWSAADITFLGATHTGRTTPVAYGGSPQDALEAILTFKPVFDLDSEFVITNVPTTGGSIISIPDNLLEGVQFLKIRSGTNALPVVQGAERLLRAVVAE